MEMGEFRKTRPGNHDIISNVWVIISLGWHKKPFCIPSCKWCLSTSSYQARPKIVAKFKPEPQTPQTPLLAAAAALLVLFYLLKFLFLLFSGRSLIIINRNERHGLACNLEISQLKLGRACMFVVLCSPTDCVLRWQRYTRSQIYSHRIYVTSKTGLK